MARNYSVSGPEAASAVQRGLAEADWYLSPVPSEQLHRLQQRRNGPALRDCALWLGLLVVSGGLGGWWWGSWWAIVPFFFYGIFYATVSDSRWHEASHGTPFRTEWCNQVLYEIASFMVQRESVPWRWSHIRHHSDTMIIGRDPEVQVPRPTRILDVVGKFFALKAQKNYYMKLIMHAGGRMHRDEMAYVPASEYSRVFLRARICLTIYVSVLLVSLMTNSILPCMYIGLPTLYGTWLMPVFTLTQHAGLQEDVLDHRRNSRTVLMNPVLRFLYWNMNYHIEHHMYPMVPYHALPALHEVVKRDLPPPLPGIVAAFREILPALWRQRQDPTWYPPRELPLPTEPTSKPNVRVAEVVDGWLDGGPADALLPGQAQRVDYGTRTYALYRTHAGKVRATDGICTHGNRHLAEGMLVGDHIECPKHHGRFHLEDGAPSRAPACRALRTYPVREQQGRLQVHLEQPQGQGARSATSRVVRVVSARLVAPFIKEVVVIPEGGAVAFEPGDYLQFAIPAYPQIELRGADQDPTFAKAWAAVGAIAVENRAVGKVNNYSIASIPSDGQHLRFYVRLALPPAGSSYPVGIGSAWMFHAKVGDALEVYGPYGEFHIQPTLREMVYIGGGAGIAPLRAHLGALLGGSQPTQRRVSFWYGARTQRELVGWDEMTAWSRKFSNFSYTAALSSPDTAEPWDGEVGMIHDVVFRRYLERHPQPGAVEYYLCGPPPMVTACREMLQRLGVPAGNMYCDAF